MSDALKCVLVGFTGGVAGLFGDASDRLAVSWDRNKLKTTVCVTAGVATLTVIVGVGVAAVFGGALSVGGVLGFSGASFVNPYLAYAAGYLAQISLPVAAAGFAACGNFFGSACALACSTAD